MLVIENPELEKKIEERAAALGKTVEEYLWYLLAKYDEDQQQKR